MGTKQIAEQLSGIEYPTRIPSEVIASAKAEGIVIVYGASDDLMEFEGAIRDEIGAYDGTTAYVDSEGLLPERDQIEDDEELQRYFSRKPNAVSIDALWAQEGGYSWTFRTEIPHETFEIVEDGSPYCRGIVFALADVGSAQS